MFQVISISLLGRSDQRSLGTPLELQVTCRAGKPSRSVGHLRQLLKDQPPVHKFQQDSEFQRVVSQL